MSISKRKTAEGWRWRWDFERGGQRFNSPCSYPTEAKARRAEKLAKTAAEAGERAPGLAPRKAAAQRRAEPEKGGPVSVAQAAARYWKDKGQHHRSAGDIWRRLEICKRLFGPDTLLSAIGFAEVSDAIEARAKEPGRAGAALSDSSINRDVIDAFRPARNHAARVWQLALPLIDWGELRRAEAPAIVCEFTDAQRQAWGDELASDLERLFLGLALVYGPRFGELFAPAESFALDAPGGPEIKLGRYLNRDGVWRDSRKDGSLHTIFISPEDAAALAPLVARAKLLGRPSPIWIEDGASESLSYYALIGRIRRAAVRAGIDVERVVHGMRHHAATNIVRNNQGALIFARDLLGHKQIKTTERYAHVNSEDMRRALGQKPAQNHAESHARTTPAPGGPVR